MTTLLFHPVRVAADAVVAAWRFSRDLFGMVGAAQRCAYAVELGRMPADRDLERLDLDRTALEALLRA